MKKFKFINEKVLLTFILSVLSLTAFSTFLSTISMDQINRLTSSINEAKKEEKVADKIDEYVIEQCKKEL